MNTPPGISPRQREKLLAPIHSGRVASRRLRGNSGPTLSYLEAWDVKAHLTRIFDFGGWSSDVIDTELVFDEKAGANHSVAWRVTLRLTIHTLGVTFTEAAIGSAQLPSHGDAHDMAIKTAESDALKRAAINLGDQFGLSLYRNGSTKPVVVATLGDGGELPSDDSLPTADAQTLGTDEVAQAEADQAQAEADVEDAQERAAEALVRQELAATPVDHAEALAALRNLATNPDDGARIKAVIEWKRQNSGILDDLTDVKGEQVTFGRLVERVTAGEFVAKEA